jgi:CBS domain-containing protein
MSTVLEVLQRKGSGVATISPDATVLQASRLMNRHRIGSLVVVEGPFDSLRGIITERDILTRVVSLRLDADKAAVSTVMTSTVTTCTPDDTLDHLRVVMQRERIRHVPVIDRGGLCGLISMGDLNAWAIESMEHMVMYLEEYIQRS